MSNKKKQYKKFVNIVLVTEYIDMYKNLYIKIWINVVKICNAIAKFDKNMINILRQYIPKHMGYEVADPLLEHEHNNTYIIKEK